MTFNCASKAGVTRGEGSQEKCVDSRQEGLEPSKAFRQTGSPVRQIESM